MMSKERRFFCTRCNRCCRHDEGYVFLSQADLERLSAGLALPIAEVVDKYCRKVHSAGFARLSLGEKRNLDCIFWEGGCTVYNHRPLQCRSYPFWAAFSEDNDGWEAEAHNCPGMNVGPVVPQSHIDAYRTQRRSEPLLVLDEEPPFPQRIGS